MATNHGIIRTIYLYLFALVGLFVFIFGAISGINAVLDRYVWPQSFVDYSVSQPIAVDGVTKPLPAPTGEDKAKNLADQKDNFEKQQANNFKSRMNGAIPSILIGWLLWWFHWGWIKKDHEA